METKKEKKMPITEKMVEFIKNCGNPLYIKVIEKYKNEDLANPSEAAKKDLLFRILRGALTA